MKNIENVALCYLRFFISGFAFFSIFMICRMHFEYILNDWMTNCPYISNIYSLWIVNIVRNMIFGMFATKSGLSLQSKTKRFTGASWALAAVIKMKYSQFGCIKSVRNTLFLALCILFNRIGMVICWNE